MGRKLKTLSQGAIDWTDFLSKKYKDKRDYFRKFWKGPYRLKPDEERGHDRKCVKCHKYCWPNYFICKSCLAISPEWWEENYYVQSIDQEVSKYDNVPLAINDLLCPLDDEDTLPLVRAYEYEDDNY